MEKINKHKYAQKKVPVTDNQIETTKRTPFISAKRDQRHEATEKIKMTTA